MEWPSADYRVDPPPTQGRTMHRRATGDPGSAMASLWWGMVFGAVGLGYCVYGRRQRAAIPLLCGIGLIAFPYFVSNAWLAALIGAVLMAIPWLIRV